MRNTWKIVFVVLTSATEKNAWTIEDLARLQLWIPKLYTVKCKKTCKTFATKNCTPKSVSCV
jgi:hypothetical protein